MVTSEIIKKLKKLHPNLKQSQLETVVKIIFQTINESLIKGKSVELRSSLGRFSIKTIKAKYNAINPSNSERIFVPPKKKVSYKMSKVLKNKINEK